MTDDSGAGASLSVAPAGAHGRDAVYELGFPDGTHFHRALFTRHRTRLHEHRRDDVVAAACVAKKIIQQKERKARDEAKAKAQADEEAKKAKKGVLTESGTSQM